MKKKILVLDDSPFMLTIIRDMLTKLNYDVTTVDNGNKACQEIESTRHDLIITDLNMPVMDGLEFTQKVRSYPERRFVPIIMLSSEMNNEKIAKARKMGVATFLNKPPKEAQLKTMLQIILSKRASPRIPAKLEVFYGQDEKLSGYAASYSVNMSVGGLFLETDNPLTPGEKLNLRFSLPGNNHPISCQGRVAWATAPGSSDKSSHPAGMGIEFLDLAEENQLKEFLQPGFRKNQ